MFHQTTARPRHKAPASRRFARPVHFLLRGRTLTAPPLLSVLSPAESGCVPGCGQPDHTELTAFVPPLELPEGHLAQRPRTYGEVVLGLRTVDAGSARIGYYQASHSVGALHLGDRVFVTVADTDDPDHELLATVAAFRPDPASPVGLTIAADDDPTFIVWYPADAVRLATSAVDDTLVMDALDDTATLIGGVR